MLRPEQLGNIFTELRRAENHRLSQAHPVGWADAGNTADDNQMNHHIECGGVATLILAYGAPLKHRRFLGYALSSACVYGGLFAYITGSPLVLITLYGISPQRFALIFATNVLGILVTAAINGRIVMRFGIDRLLAFGVLAAAISGTLLGLSALSGWGGLIALLVPLFFFLATIGFVGANAVAGCLSLFPTRAGSASALVGTLQFLTGALASALLGAISGTSALPMAGSIALAGILSLVIQRTLARACSPERATTR